MIGTHAIRFTHDGGALRVESQLDLTVKMAFITVYRYEQTGQDDWQDGALVRTSIRDHRRRQGYARGRGGEGRQARGRGAGRDVRDQLGSMTDLSFWNEGITDGPPVIDSQTGELIEISVQPDATETITVRRTASRPDGSPWPRPRGGQARSGTTMPAVW